MFTISSEDAGSLALGAFKPDDVLDMEITFAELIGAYATIRQQASTERKGPRQPGEASGAPAAP